MHVYKSKCITQACKCFWSEFNVCDFKTGIVNAISEDYQTWRKTFSSSVYQLNFIMCLESFTLAVKQFKRTSTKKESLWQVHGGIHIHWSIILFWNWVKDFKQPYTVPAKGRQLFDNYLAWWAENGYSISSAPSQCLESCLHFLLNLCLKLRSFLWGST